MNKYIWWRILLYILFFCIFTFNLYNPSAFSILACAITALVPTLIILLIIKFILILKKK